MIKGSIGKSDLRHLFLSRRDMLLLSILFFGVALQAKEPASMSYGSVVECFPDLAQLRPSQSLDLNELRDQIDSRYITSSTLLRMRTLQLKDADGQKRRLRLIAKKGAKGGYDYELSYHLIDSKGLASELPIQKKHKVNPFGSDLAVYIGSQELLSDEYQYTDQKLRGVAMNYVKLGTKIVELELVDSRLRRSLECSINPELGAICHCAKKSK